MDSPINEAFENEFVRINSNFSSEDFRVSSPSNSEDSEDSREECEILFAKLSRSEFENSRLQKRFKNCKEGLDKAQAQLYVANKALAAIQQQEWKDPALELDAETFAVHEACVALYVHNQMIPLLYDGPTLRPLLSLPFSNKLEIRSVHSTSLIVVLGQNRDFKPREIEINLDDDYCHEEKATARVLHALSVCNLSELKTLQVNALEQSASWMEPLKLLLQKANKLARVKYEIRKPTKSEEISFDSVTEIELHLTLLKSIMRLPSLEYLAILVFSEWNKEDQKLLATELIKYYFTGHFNNLKAHNLKVEIYGFMDFKLLLPLVSVADDLDVEARHSITDNQYVRKSAEHQHHLIFGKYNADF